MRPAVSRTPRSAGQAPTKKRASTPRTPAKKSPKKSAPRSPAKKKIPKKAYRSKGVHRAQSKIAPAKKSHRSTAKQTKRGHEEHLAQRRQRAGERRAERAWAAIEATAKRRAAALKGWKSRRVREHAGFDHLKNALGKYKRDGESESYELFRHLKRQLFQTNELDPSHPNYLPAETIEKILIQAALDAGWDELHAARFAKDS